MNQISQEPSYQVVLELNMTEQEILEKLTAKFPYLAGKGRVARARRIFCDVPNANFLEVLDFVIKELGFSILTTMTGTDEGETLGFMYHLASNNGMVLNLKINAPKDNPVIKTVTDIFPTAEMYEREVVDLLGAKVDGLAPGRRYPLHDQWPLDEHPLRKDWVNKKVSSK
jgi:Ni,Fe-hydrogenase III component G